jgi:hypothetical protein
MINLLTITFGNVINLLLGILLGFMIMLAVFCGVISRLLSKQNKNDKIRNISKNAYYNYFTNNKNTKDAILNSLIYEIKEVSSLVYPNDENAIYELSINDIIKALKIIQKKTQKIVDHPLCKDIKYIHISKLIYLEENIAKPIINISKNKIVRKFYKAINLVRKMLNVFNPIFYMRLIVNKILIKKGKKEVLLITYDFIGNTIYEIYNNENNLQK